MPTLYSQCVCDPSLYLSIWYICTYVLYYDVCKHRPNDRSVYTSGGRQNTCPNQNTVMTMTTEFLYRVTSLPRDQNSCAYDLFLYIPRRLIRCFVAIAVIKFLFKFLTLGRVRDQRAFINRIETCAHNFFLRFVNIDISRIVLFVLYLLSIMNV